MVLIVLDGWGYSEKTEFNAIHAARTPVWDRLWAEYPHTLIRCAGAEVGLPSDQMGNSEVGHLNLGAGRVVYQIFTRINRTLKSGTFFTNPTLGSAIHLAARTGKAVHVLGLLSPGGVHSHEEHIQATVEMALKGGVERVYLHAFLDGRDTPPQSAAASIAAMEARFAALGGGRFASLIGRYYAMDRDHRWSRTQAAYELISRGTAQFSAPDALSGLELAYARGETDEFVRATTVVPPGGQAVRVEDGDVVIFANYRSDRARQLTRAFIAPDFEGFPRGGAVRLGAFVSLTEYDKDFDIPVAFPPERLPNVLGAYLAQLGLRQLRLAETEKYAHVTFFFNGGEETPFEGEDRILVPSPQVATYDLQPEMSAPEVTERLIAAVRGGKYDLIVCNYANADMVGHAWDFAAAVRAIEAVDTCLGRVVKAVQAVGGELVITADHGNAEQMRDEATGQAHTAHTSNLVPFLYVGRAARLLPTGSLADVAPTLLHLMGLEQPAEMSGQPLVELSAARRVAGGDVA